jgi:hypothetical protein
MSLNKLSITSRAESLNLEATVISVLPCILSVYSVPRQGDISPRQLLAQYCLIDALEPDGIDKLQYQYSSGLAGAPLPLHVAGTIGVMFILKAVHEAREEALVRYRPVGQPILGMSIPLALREWVQITKRQEPGWWGRFFHRKPRTPRQVVDRMIATGKLVSVQ